MITSQVRSLARIFTLGTLLITTHAAAAQDASEVCAEVAKKAGRTLWASVRESGDDLFCRKSWVPALPDELAACGGWSVAQSFSSKVKNLWNRAFTHAEWATWGARAIGPDWEEGTIRGGFKRTFFGAGLAYTLSSFEVVKEGGAAEANVTACVLDYDGNVVGASREKFEAGKGGEGTTRRFDFMLENNRIVALVVDTPVQLAGRSFEYRARQQMTPRKLSTATAKGIADLHVHQLFNLAFGGRVMWGQHAGPPETALAKEQVNFIGAGFDLTTVDGLLKTLAQPGVSVDANIVFALAGGGTTDEGFWKYGGEGFPSYRDWPHHADRSHHQAHIAWVKEAHERHESLERERKSSNLTLLVVSVVNNDVLCNVGKLLDPYGNVPIWNEQMKITGWESRGWGCSDHENVLRQLEALHQLERQNPWYRIAMSPWHARQIIEDGDLAVVISMETDKPLSEEGNTGGNWERQLDFYRALGLTSMQVVHESNSRFCGAALHRDMMELLQAIHWPLKSLDDLFSRKFEVDSSGYNKLGLTPAGEKLIDALVKRNMPIDLAHGSQRCREGILARVGSRHGVYDSHTKFGRLLGGHVLAREQEFHVSEGLLPLYKKHRVLVGLRTGSTDSETAPNSKVDNNCPGSARSFAQQVQYAHAQGLDIAYGTDFNTGVAQLGPRGGTDEQRCWASLERVKNRVSRAVSEKEDLPDGWNKIPPIAGTNYYTHGLATIGWLPELTVDLVEHLKTPGAEKLQDGAEAFLRMWERSYPARSGGTVLASGTAERGRGTVALGGSCKSGDQCASGRCTGVAGAKGVCVCNEDADCAGDAYCDDSPDLVQNRCIAKKANDASCALVGGGHQCQSGTCKYGRCYEPASVAFGGSCYVNDACKQGKCSAVNGARGSCVCDADGDCGDGFWCDRGADLHKNSCKRKFAKGEVCGTVGELGTDHRCASGQCAVGGISTKLVCK